MRGEVACSIDYRRHFILLAAVTASLVLTDRWRPVVGAVPSVGLDGVLHSATLVAALRPSQTAWRSASFVIGAAGLAMSTVAAVRLAGHLLAATPGMGRPAVLLTLSSGLGAASYGLLIRRCWNRDLPYGALACITLCCMTSTLVALPLGIYLHTVGGAWFAMIWWWAFSLALWYCDRALPQIEVPRVW